LIDAANAAMNAIGSAFAPAILALPQPDVAIPDPNVVVSIEAQANQAGASAPTICPRR
jgi:hypothetical protein